MPSGRIIVVEDENLTRTTLVQALNKAGYATRGAADASACRAALHAEPADLVILDLGLPGQDGLSYARELRAAGDIAVLIVTARSSPATQVAALDGGADGYLVKPVDLDALAAHVRALFRRNQTDASRMRFGGYVLDTNRRTLTNTHGKIENLTRGEFNLLALLAQAEGRIVSREMLSEAVNRPQCQTPSNIEGGDARSVDALVSRLRRKLAPAALIGTSTGFGYRLCAEVVKE